MKNEPLYLPKGSVRAIIILIITNFLMFSVWFEKTPPEIIIVSWVGMVGWYFGGKIDDFKSKENQ